MVLLRGEEKLVTKFPFKNYQQRKVIFHFYFSKDVFARCPNGDVKVMKLLSVDPKNYPDAPVSDVFFQKIETKKNPNF